MSSVIRLHFSTTIAASPSVVWGHITAPDSYRQWTSAFAEGSHFQGSWEQGAKILFLSPTGEGMVSEIAECRLHEFISIRHLGFFLNGVEDRESEAVRAWAPAYENYTLVPVPEGTRMVVDQDVPADWAEHLSLKWPKALELLKGLSEQPGSS